MMLENAAGPANPWDSAAFAMGKYVHSKKMNETRK
jgi:hypothetical protein